MLSDLVRHLSAQFLKILQSVGSVLALRFQGKVDSFHHSKDFLFLESLPHNLDAHRRSVKNLRGIWNSYTTQLLGMGSIRSDTTYTSRNSRDR